MDSSYRLTQWCVVVDGEKMAMFTPSACDAETAMAIAVATFGDVTGIVDEGLTRQQLSPGQLHVADPRWCAKCAQYLSRYGDGHDEQCPLATEVA